jgi:hypothetical protein
MDRLKLNVPKRVGAQRRSGAPPVRACDPLAAQRVPSRFASPLFPAGRDRYRSTHSATGEEKATA